MWVKYIIGSNVCNFPAVGVMQFVKEVPQAGLEPARPFRITGF